MNTCPHTKNPDKPLHTTHSLQLYSYVLRTLRITYIQLRVSQVALQWQDQKYRVSIKSFPDYKHLLQENYRATKRAYVEV